MLSGLCLWVSAFLLHFLAVTRLKRAYGVQWDRHLNPCCPLCGTHLANIGIRRLPDTELAVGETGQCLRCKTFHGVDATAIPEGFPADFRNARRMLLGQPPQRENPRRAVADAMGL
jgi:hypothetical protein